MEDGRIDYAPFSAKVSVGYPRNGGTGRRLLSPRRARLCSRRIPSHLYKHTDAPDKRSAPLWRRLDPQWMGARGVS